MKRKLFYLIWCVSEFTGISLGDIAPFVFERMLGIENNRREIIEND